MKGHLSDLVIADLAADQLSRTRVEAAREHLFACSQCRRFLARQIQIREGLERARAPRPSDDLTARLLGLASSDPAGPSTARGDAKSSPGRAGRDVSGARRHPGSTCDPETTGHPERTRPHEDVGHSEEPRRPLHRVRRVLPVLVLATSVGSATVMILLGPNNDGLAGVAPTADVHTGSTDVELPGRGYVGTAVHETGPTSVGGSSDASP